MLSQPDPKKSRFEAMEAYLPKTLAGRLGMLDALYRGAPIYDENDQPTGEYTGPLISKETYLRLIEATVSP